MVKRARTWHFGGGDNPLRSIRYYRFSYDESIWDRFARRSHKVELNCDFEIRFDLPVCSDETRKQEQVRHMALANSREFYIKDRNVLEWFDDMATRGASVIEFAVDSSVAYVIRGQPPRKSVTARFSDPGLATMFKLAFGGK